MKVSTRGKYGIRAMLDIANRHSEGPVTLRSIAERQDISESYLEHLIASLRKADLVVSSRGAQGGYQLARDPAEIRVGDIIRALEGPIAPSACASEELNRNGCQNLEHCAVRVLWGKIRDSITEVIDSTTLEDLVEISETLDQPETMYYI